MTGAASGIGRATAIQLAGDGYRVVAVDRDPTGLATLATELADTAEVVCRTADLGDATTPAALVDDAAAQWGRLDVLALVAGMGQRGPATSIPVELWDRVIDVNLRAPFLLAREAFDHLEKAGGAVVAVSSVAGMQGWPYSAAYSASKGGLITVMRTLALEFGLKGVRVNIICPGSVDTGLATGMRQDDFDAAHELYRRPGGIDGRIGTPSEIATTIAFLASPAASYINGAVLRADGGAYA